jgi:hypothetical protein
LFIEMEQRTTIAPTIGRSSSWQFQIGGVDMTDKEVWLALARECPRRIMSELHCCGAYHHGTVARFPGKVLCCHKDTELHEGWKPTPAQVLARQASERNAAQHADLDDRTRLLATNSF